MKNYINQNKFYSSLVYTIATSMLVIFFVACNNKKSSAPPPAPVYPMYGVNAPMSLIAAQGCTGCLNVGQLAFMATTDSENVRGTMYLGLDFYADVTRGFDLNDPKLPTKYTGITEVHGKMVLKATDTDFCNAPPGEYEVRTLNPGSWQMGVTSSGLSGYGPGSLTLEARLPNGYFFILTMAQGIIYNPSINGTNKLETNRLGGTLAVQSFNNQVCRSLLGSVITLELF